MGQIVTDIATRVSNHNWSLDPIFRSMLDMDFYKLLMAQLIWKQHKSVKVTFGLTNRTKTVKLGKELDEREVVRQFDHARTIRLTRAESIWLRGNTFYGKQQIFDPAFVDWLENFTLPNYTFRIDNNNDYDMTFSGSWLETTFWEIPCLSIINELRSRVVLKSLSRFETDIVYARAKSKLWDKAERLKKLYSNGYEFKVSDFGTRRRHSFLWQRWAVQALQEAIGPNFIGTSNVLLAMQNDLEAIGTNAHELPMVYAALANNDTELMYAPYKVLHDWEKMYDHNLKIILPDTFGTTNFLKQGQPLLSERDKWHLSTWKGIRPDSKPCNQGTQEAIDFWKTYGEDPKEKLVILSDGMDIDSIEGAVKKYSNQTNISIGWGTNLTNDFKGCTVDNTDSLRAISLVCKVAEANGRPAVKLSDNPAKCMGDPAEIERYKRIFNYNETVSTPVEV